MKLVDLNGLQYFWGKIKGLVSSKTSIYKGSCSTAKGTATKVVTTENFPTETINNTTTPLDGTMIAVKFSITNTAASPKLNVNGLGALPIYYNNATYTSNSNIAGYANRWSFFMYDKTSNAWIWLGHGTDNNTTYSAMTQAEINAGTSTTARLLTPKLLRDNIYTEDEVDALLANKADRLMVVNVSLVNDDLSAGKTYEEITQALSNGTSIVVKYGNEYYHLQYSGNNSLTFAYIPDDGLTINTLGVDNNDAWSVDSYNIQPLLSEMTVEEMDNGQSTSPRVLTPRFVKLNLTRNFEVPIFLVQEEPVEDGDPTPLPPPHYEVDTSVSFWDIQDACSSGKRVVALTHDGVCYLSSCTDEEIIFKGYESDANVTYTLTEITNAQQGDTDIRVVRDAYELANVAKSGSYNDLGDKPINVSSFTNDVGYLTQHQDISGKQDVLTFDSTPTANSTNPVTSGGIKTALNKKVETVELFPLLFYLNANQAISEATAVAPSNDNAELFERAINTFPYLDSDFGYIEHTYLGYPAYKGDYNDTGQYDWVVYGYPLGNNITLASMGVVEDNGTTKYYIKGQRTLFIATNDNLKTINSTSLFGGGNINLQTPLTFDSTPTANSNNVVKSGGVYTALQGKKNAESTDMVFYFGLTKAALIRALNGSSEDNPVTLSGTALEKWNELIADVTDEKRTWTYAFQPVAVNYNDASNRGVTFMGSVTSNNQEPILWEFHKDGNNYWMTRTTVSYAKTSDLTSKQDTLTWATTSDIDDMMLEEVVIDEPDPGIEIEE